MPQFGKRSKDNLLSCDPRLIDICQDVIQHYDFTVLEGYRSRDRQDELYAQGKSKLKGGQSKHNAYPSLAVDLAPYPIDWDDTRRFYILAGMMFQSAHAHGVTIRWGGDWNRNWNLDDQKFFDLPHFEVLNEPAI